MPPEPVLCSRCELREQTGIRGRVLRILGAEADAEVRAFCRALGRERRKQGFALSEVLSALTLLRKAIRAFSREFPVQERTLDFYRVMELERRIVLFFDKALYHASRSDCVGGGQGKRRRCACRER